MKKINGILILICLMILSCVFTSCGHKHTFADATCTAPKVCTDCGAEEGSPLGHLVGIGVCDQCGEIVAEDDLSALIYSSVLEKIENFNKGVDRIYITDLGSYISDVAYLYDLYLVPVKDELNAANKICKKYDELKSASNSLNSAINIFPKKPNSYYSLDDMKKFYNDLSSVMSYYRKANENYLKILE